MTAESALICAVFGTNNEKSAIVILVSVFGKMFLLTSVAIGPSTPHLCKKIVCYSKTY